MLALDDGPAFVLHGHLPVGSCEPQIPHQSTCTMLGLQSMTKAPASSTLTKNVACARIVLEAELRLLSSCHG